MLLLLLAGVLATQPIQDDGFAYRVTLVRAAPGDLLELIDLYRERATFYDAAGEMRPVIIRHSQGDHWDLMLVQPIGNLGAYFSEAAVNRRRTAEEEAAAGAAPPDWSRSCYSDSWRCAGGEGSVGEEDHRSESAGAAGDAGSRP